jgi:hypothetical protein
MIAALVTLIISLFFGGPNELFYVDDLDKGIKKHIVDKERKKELLTDYKLAKSSIKAFEKARKKDFKEFVKLYKESSTNTEQLTSFLTELESKRNKFQSDLIDTRVSLYKKIEPQEWENILATSTRASEKRIEKLEKSKAKGKEAYGKTFSAINSTISDESKRAAINNSLKEIISSVQELENMIISVNTSDNTILADKNSSREDLLKITNKEAELRVPIIESLIDFHQTTKQNCSADEFETIMKSFLKEGSMSSR